MITKLRFALPLCMLAALAVLPTASSAAISQNFTVGIPKIAVPKGKSDGPYTFTLGWTTTADGGASVPPPVIDVEMRLPAGVEIRKQFLRGSYVCDINKLKQQRATSACPKALVGEGDLTMDFRPFTTNVQAKVYVFLAKPAQNGAVASLAVLAVPDASNPFVIANPVVANTKPVMVANMFKGSGSGYGYRVELPVDIDAPVLVSVLSFSATFKGLQMKKKGRKLFWVSQPNCKSKKAKFQATFSYVNAASITVPAYVKKRFKCPKTSKRSKKRKRKR